MAVTLSGAEGLFQRLGHIFRGIESANFYAGDTAISGSCLALGTSFTNIQGVFQSSDQDLVNTFFSSVTSQRNAMSIKTALKNLAQVVVIDMVNDDAPLTQLTLENALVELIDQMAGAGTSFAADDDVDASVVSVTTAAGTTPANTGNGTVAASVTRPDGRTCENAYAEVITVTVTNDKNAGGTLHQETLEWKGEAAASDKLAHDWPLGSGSTGTLSATDAAQNAQGVTGNILTNSDFDDQTSNVPNSWILTSGTAGTDILTETTAVNRSGSSVEFFNDHNSSGLPSIVYSGLTVFEPNKVYAFGLWARRTLQTSGTLQVSLLDENDNVINNDAGNANTVATAVSSVTSGAFDAITGFFQTPKTIVKSVTPVKVRVRLSANLNSGGSLFLDDMSLTEAKEAYNGGPFIAAFAGSSGFRKGDYFDVTVSQGREGKFQEYFERCFDMSDKGSAADRLQLPSDTGGSENLLDTLISDI